MGHDISQFLTKTKMIEILLNVLVS